MTVKQRSPYTLSYETKTIIVVLTLVTVYPIGAYLMTRWMNWPRWLKFVLLLPIILIVIAIVGIILTAFVSRTGGKNSEGKSIKQCVDRCEGLVEKKQCVKKCSVNPYYRTY